MQFGIKFFSPSERQPMSGATAARAASRRPLRDRRSHVLEWLHRWGMVLSVVALLCWLWGLFFWFNAQQKRQLLVDRGAELSLMSNAVAQHAAGMFRAVESDLRTLDLWLATHPGADPLRDPRFLVLVDEMRRSSGGLIDPRMVSAEGQLYYLPSPEGRALADVSDREYFKLPQQPESGGVRRVHIGAPVQSRVTQRWLIPVSLLMSSQTGDEAQAIPGTPPRMKVIFAAVELERLAAEHERMRFRPDGTISLVRADGVVLSRTPLNRKLIGRNVSTAPNFGHEYGRQWKGSFVSKGSLTDGIERLVSYERLPDYPVTVLVSRGLDEIYASYQRRLRTVLGLSMLLSAAVLGFTFFLHRSQQARLALQVTQDQLRRLATTDELTGVMNRRAFIEAAQREFERTQRYRRLTAVLALDIDHFKTVNDEYGHAGGDLVLQACAARWQAALREHDLLGRTGGEEFCVVLPETSGTDAAHVAERLRAAIEGTPVLGTTRRVSVSIGWTVIVATDTAWAPVLQRADAALYKAKHGGRNRVHPPTVVLHDSEAASRLS